MASNRVAGHRDIHPDDTKVRLEFAKAMNQIRKSTKVVSDALKAKEGKSDWTLGSMKEWANFYHIRLTFTFEGFDHVPAFATIVDGDVSELPMVMKRKVVDLAVYMRLTGVEMDRRLGQRKTFQTWKNRKTPDVNLSTIQRMVRALGGRLVISLEHRYNAGMTIRINR